MGDWLKLVIMGHFWPYPSNMEIWSARQFFCHFGPYFAKYQNSEKLKKAPGDIIILYLCTIMMIIWCMVPEIWSTTDIFLSFWASFCPSTAVTTQKIKIMKNWNKHLEISSFYMCTTNDDHMMYDSSDMECDRLGFLLF